MTGEALIFPAIFLWGYVFFNVIEELKNG